MYDRVYSWNSFPWLIMFPRSISKKYIHVHIPHARSLETLGQRARSCVPSKRMFAIACKLGNYEFVHRRALCRDRCLSVNLIPTCSSCEDCYKTDIDTPSFSQVAVWFRVVCSVSLFHHVQ